MKQTKVKLLRTMREESDKFRQWRKEHEKECQRLKQQDRKKENEIVKMKAMHTKQQNVFKRRVEEAEALNKRLKNMLALRKQGQDAKIQGKVERIGPWLKQEFDVYINLVEAEATLAALLEDRATLQHQLDELKANPATADTSECKSIEEDIELRSVQIQDLQQKLLDSDEENKSKTRFDKFQSMGEAKFALKALFEQAAEIQKEKIQTQLKLNELQESYNEIQDKVKETETQSKVNQEKNLQQLEQLQKMYEEKVAILLRQLRGVKVDDVSRSDEMRQMYSIQQEKIEEQECKIQELESLNKALEEKLKYSESHGDHTPVQAFRKRPNPPLKVNDGTFILEEKENVDLDLETSVIDDSDDIQKDPDWRKTPLGKRIIEEKKKMTLARTTLNFNGTGPIKRSSEGGCMCKTNCQRLRCGCKKLNIMCGSSCKCSSGVCENRESIDQSSANSDDNEDAFKKPRLLDDDDEQHKRPKTRTRHLFKMQL